ncbi:MAG: hypothetical protein JWL81_911 [Verrucomicrobiales bacterium]|nr:hypothetical protein [Verrucomicrobiales bacterium]
MKYEITLSDAGFTRRQRVDKAIHTLEGILAGISLDGVIVPLELNELTAWISDHRALIGRHPFSELVPRIEAALADGVIDAEEHADILWLCRNMQCGSLYYDEATTDMQRLQGMLHGILADAEVSEDEIRELSRWIDEHAHLKGCYPYDEIDALLTQVLKDGTEDQTEREMLKHFFEDFISYSLQRRVKDAREQLPAPKKLAGICSVCPDLSFLDRIYTFTGASQKATRVEMASKVESLGGHFSQKVHPKVHFLIVGANGNPAWAYACYGRKVEQAMNLRADGHPVIIVHENDFWDAMQDHQAPIK